jgi:Chromo (CHRromatin Organisation MOdifier) domain
MNDEEEDDISLHSSDSEQEEEYTVEEILAERGFEDEELRYLVKWENYDEDR